MKDVLLRKLSRVSDILKSQCLDFQEMLRYYRASYRRSVFNIAAFNEGFADRNTGTAGTPEDLALAERIIAAYKKAKQDEKGAPPGLSGPWRMGAYH